jgi:hypothetical protein
LSIIVFSAAVVGLSRPALAHDCRLKDGYLVGNFHGECDERTELAEGAGEAKGANSYVGNFAKGRPDGKGVYTWEDGSRLEGSFKDGKAHGTGIYVSAKGVRYEGRFANGKLEGMKASDCPAVPAPVLSC